MRVFTASLATETNTFSPIPSDRASFEQAFYAGPGDHPDTPTLCSAVIPALRHRAALEGFELIEGTATWAEPGGYLRTDHYEALRDEILQQLQDSLPVDCVVLGLHGAMVAGDIDDCEGDLLERVRQLVGTEVIVAAEFDPHSHLTAKRVSALDIMAAFLEFPHTDFAERAEHVVDLALAATRGEIKPIISTFDCRMIDVFPTNREPMRSFVDSLKALQNKDGILSLSLIHGFMAADVPAMGTQMVVVTDSQEERGKQLAEELGMQVFGMRGTTRMKTIDVQAAVRLAIQSESKSKSLSDHDHGSRKLSQYTGKALVFADIWDNPGGGTAGDNTDLLRALIEADINNAALATLWDPQAAAIAQAAGEGAVLEMRIGGKSHRSSGTPIDGIFQVRRLATPGYQSFGGSQVTLGNCAVLRLLNTQLDIIVNTNRTQAFEPNIFSNLGIEPESKSILVVKSTNHFRASFEPVAKDIFYIAIDGIYPNDPTVTAYKKASRNIWPIRENPFDRGT